MAEGAREHALAFASLEDFDRVSAALQALEGEAARGRQASVTVVGAGYAGVELAACVQHRLADKAQVQIVSAGDRILPVRLPLTGLVHASACLQTCCSVACACWPAHPGVRRQYA